MVCAYVDAINITLNISPIMLKSSFFYYYKCPELEC